MQPAEQLADRDAKQREVRLHDVQVMVAQLKAEVNAKEEDLGRASTAAATWKGQLAAVKVEAEDALADARSKAEQAAAAAAAATEFSKERAALQEELQSALTRAQASEVEAAAACGKHAQELQEAQESQSAGERGRISERSAARASCLASISGTPSIPPSSSPAIWPISICGAGDTMGLKAKPRGITSSTSRSLSTCSA